MTSFQVCASLLRTLHVLLYVALRTEVCSSFFFLRKKLLSSSTTAQVKREKNLLLHSGRIRRASLKATFYLFSPFGIQILLHRRRLHRHLTDYHWYAKQKKNRHTKWTENNIEWMPLNRKPLSFLSLSLSLKRITPSQRRNRTEEKTKGSWRMYIGRNTQNIYIIITTNNSKPKKKDAVHSNGAQSTTEGKLRQQSNKQWKK